MDSVDKKLEEIREVHTRFIQEIGETTDIDALKGTKTVVRQLADELSPLKAIPDERIKEIFNTFDAVIAAVDARLVMLSGELTNE
jgi:hypothetical protein